MAENLNKSINPLEVFVEGITRGWTLSKGLLRSPEIRTVSYPDDRRGACYKIEENSFWFEHRQRCLEEILTRFPPDGIFLDVGGGNGFVSGRLAGQGISTVLVEPGEEGCRNALARGLPQVLCGSLENLNFEKNKAGAIGLFDVLEHTTEDLAFLKTTHQALKDRGRIYITVPAYPALWSGFDESAGHCRRYTANALKALLETTGFRPLFSSYFFSFLLIPVLLARVLPYRLRRGKQGPIHAVSPPEHLSSIGPLRNAVLNLFSFETVWLKYGSIPFGTSLIGVGEKIK